MITQNLSIIKKNLEKYPIIENGVYLVILEDVVSERKATFDTKMLEESQKKYEDVLNFSFKIATGENADRILWVNFVPTYLYVSKKHGKNKLYKIIESLLKRPLHDDDLKKMEHDSMNLLNSLIGKECMVVIEQKNVGEKIYSNIVNFLPSTKQTKQEEVRPTAPTSYDAQQMAQAFGGVVESKEIRVEDIPF